MSDTIRLPLIGCAFLAGLSIVSIPRAIAAPRPGVIGEYERVGLESDHPYGPTAGSGGWIREVRFPRATYVRLHFSAFDLASGDWLEVAGPSGERATRYTARGPFGTGEFWASTIPGDTAIVTLHSERGGGQGFVVDGAGRGTAPVFGPSDPPSADAVLSEPFEFGRVCGATDWRDAACYLPNDVEIYKHARAAVLVIAGCCNACTAFKVSDTGQFLFTDLCARQAEPQALELFFDYQNTTCGGSVAESSRSSYGLLTQASDPFDGGLDYRLILSADSAQDIPCLALERHAASLGDPIYIPQHLDSGAKVIAVTSDRDPGGLCQIDALPSGIRSPQTDIAFMCDTSPSNSLGAPVISATTHRVLGISHYGNCPNAASRADKILKQIDSVLDGCSIRDGCTVLSGGRCNCDGICTDKERQMSNVGHICGDCPPPEPQ